jgi:ankyrin repeat protein
MGKFVQKNSRVAELIVQKIDDEKKEMAFTRALSQASLFSTPDVVRFLISNGAEPNPIGFDWNNYPLGNAAMVNNIGTLKELLKHGANPDYREPDFNPSPLEAGFNPSPLELAESRGYKEAVDLMREKLEK